MIEKGRDQWEGNSFLVYSYSLLISKYRQLKAEPPKASLEASVK